MIDYLYDETFQGLLTCIYYHYYEEKAEGIYPQAEYQPSMLHNFKIVETDEEKAERVYRAIGEKISRYALRVIYRAYLSADHHKENKILRYILLGFKEGYGAGYKRGNVIVHEVEALAKKVSVERERMLQFVRFSLLKGGILFAEVEPDHDVLELIGDHFADRFRNDPLIIRDAGRGKSLVAYNNSWYITDSIEGLITGGEAFEVSDEEKDYRQIWKTYFENIAIEERRNTRCQRNFMPARYWKHLTEMI